MAKVRKHLPLIQVLKEIKPYQRQIVVDHLDDDACQSLGFCVSTVLSQGNSLINRKQVKCCVKANKSTIKNIIKSPKTKKQRQAKKHALAAFGGGPLALILSTAIPLLLNLLKK